MNPAVQPLARWLTFAGSLPFFLCVAASLGGLSLPLDPVAVLKAYALVIAAFMAGTVWGYVIPAERAGGGRVLLVVSNAVALVVFAAALAPPRATLAIDAGAFLALAATDGAAARLGWIGREYVGMRLAVTALVLLALGVALWAL